MNLLAPFSKILLLILLGLLMREPARAQTPVQPTILPMQQRAKVQNTWLSQRLHTVIPMLMHREEIDMWVIIAREYNEDPIIKTMLPATWQSARRRTILVFFDDGTRIEKLAVARYNIGDFFASAWNKEQQPDQWKRLAEIISDRNPNRIALNYSDDFALADGITKTQYDAFMAALPQTYTQRVISGENLAIGWLETRITAEMTVYPQICSIAHGIIAEGFSQAAIQPGVTTTTDLEWWYRQRIRQRGLTAWFHPSVSVQRGNQPQNVDDGFSERPEQNRIRPGDLLHVDFGITYLGLNTDTQQHAYVLKPGETKAPKGLRNALHAGNQLQDILLANFKEGRTGNQILAQSRQQALNKGLTPSIYTHPIGFHGHAAGPTIGLWDQQQGVEGKGDYPLHANTAYSIELNATVNIPEWDKDIRIMLEEDAFFDGDSVRYIDGRQQQLWLIPRQ